MRPPLNAVPLNAGGVFGRNERGIPPHFNYKECFPVHCLDIYLTISKSRMKGTEVL